MTFKNIFLIILVFLPLMLTIPGSGTDQSSNNVNNYSISFGLGYPIRFSSSQNNGTGILNFFYSYIINNNFYSFNTTVSEFNNYQAPTSNMVNLTTLTNASIINDFNYFISNNSKFIILSTDSISNGEQINIFNLENNNNFTIGSNSTYNIGTIVNLGNSSDIYFSFYNNSVFSIARYNFSSNSFSVFFNSTNLSKTNATIFNVNEFTLNNQFYVSLTSRNQYNLAKVNTSIFILNKNGVAFNKSLTGLNINTFTPFDNGLILYSMANSTYYKYFFSSGTYFTFLPPFQNYFNVTELYPFDNNSFILSNYNNLAIINIQDSNATSFFESNDYNFYQNQVLVQGFTIQGSKFYLLKGIDNYAQVEILIQNISIPPYSFLPTSTNASSLSSSYSTNYQSSTFFTSTASNSLFGALVVFLIIIAIPIVAILLVITKRKERVYPPIRNDSYITRNQNAIQYNNQSTSKYNYQFCRTCGTSFQPGDVFCQNCGNRL